VLEVFEIQDRRMPNLPVVDGRLRRYFDEGVPSAGVCKIGPAANPSTGRTSRARKLVASVAQVAGEELPRPSGKRGWCGWGDVRPSSATSNAKRRYTSTPSGPVAGLSEPATVLDSTRNRRYLPDTATAMSEEVASRSPGE
jgi:hypothetical protein